MEKRTVSFLDCSFYFLSVRKWTTGLTSDMLPWFEEETRRALSTWCFMDTCFARKRIFWSLIPSFPTENSCTETRIKLKLMENQLFYKRLKIRTFGQWRNFPWRNVKYWNISNTQPKITDKKKDNTDLLPPLFWNYSSANLSMQLSYFSPVNSLAKRANCEDFFGGRSSKLLTCFKFVKSWMKTSQTAPGFQLKPSC